MAKFPQWWSILKIQKHIKKTITATATITITKQNEMETNER